MCEKSNQKIMGFLKGIVDRAWAEESQLEVKEQKPLAACAILTGDGNVFGAVINNLASHDNFDGDSPVEQALEGLERYKALLKKDFPIAVVAVTTFVNPQNSKLTPWDWDYFGREKRILAENGVLEVLHFCPKTTEYAMLSL